MMETTLRLTALRELMREERLSAYIVSGTDPHHGYLVAAHWRSLQWLIGIDDFVGTAVVTQSSIALWVAHASLGTVELIRGKGFQLFQTGKDITTIPQWLGRELNEVRSPEVAIDGMCIPAARVEELIIELRRQGGITFRTNWDPFQRIWKDRPPLPQNPVGVLPSKNVTESVLSKMRRIRQALREEHADGMLVSDLDDIAWTLNLRGSDVEGRSVFVAYLLIATDRATLFIDRRKLMPDLVECLRIEGINVDDYFNVAQGLRDYFEYNILMDPQETSYTLMGIPERHVLRQKSPIPSIKK